MIARDATWSSSEGTSQIRSCPFTPNVKMKQKQDTQTTTVSGGACGVATMNGFVHGVMNGGIAMEGVNGTHDLPNESRGATQYEAMPNNSEDDIAAQHRISTPSKRKQDRLLTPVNADPTSTSPGSSPSGTVSSSMSNGNQTNGNTSPLMRTSARSSTLAATQKSLARVSSPMAGSSKSPSRTSTSTSTSKSVAAAAEGSSDTTSAAAGGGGGDDDGDDNQTSLKKNKRKKKFRLTPKRKPSSTLKSSSTSKSLSNSMANSSAKRQIGMDTDDDDDDDDDNNMDESASNSNSKPNSNSNSKSKPNSKPNSKPGSPMGSRGVSPSLSNASNMSNVSNVSSMFKITPSISRSVSPFGSPCRSPSSRISARDRLHVQFVISQKTQPVPTSYEIGMTVMSKDAKGAWYVLVSRVVCLVSCILYCGVCVCVCVCVCMYVCVCMCVYIYVCVNLIQVQVFSF